LQFSISGHLEENMSEIVQSHPAVKTDKPVLLQPENQTKRHEALFA
jgi:hypothetical protein